MDHASKALAKAAGVPELSGLGVIHDAAIARIAELEAWARDAKYILANNAVEGDVKSEELVAKANDFLKL